jgi:Domain of unknown function DUF29
LARGPAARARRGEVEGLDLDDIAEELEGMARSDRREIRNLLIVLLIHLLKLRKRAETTLLQLDRDDRRAADADRDCDRRQSEPTAVPSGGSRAMLRRGPFAHCC